MLEQNLNTNTAPKRLIIISIFLIILILVSIGIYFNFSSKIESSNTPILPSSQTTNRELKETNTNFASALEARNNGNLSESIRLYTDALNDPGLSNRAKSIVEINIGSTFMQLGRTYQDKKDGFENLKKVAQEITNDEDIRAHAVQSMGQWYAAYHDPEIYSIIFDDADFELFKSSNREESLNNLYTQATSLYPLSISTFKKETWNLEVLNASTSISSTTRKSYLPIIEKTLSIGDKDIRHIQEDGNSIDLNSVYLAKARFLQEVEKFMGDQKYGNPEEWFARSMDGSKLYRVSLTQGHILLYQSIYYDHKQDFIKANSFLDVLLSDEKIMSSNFRLFLINLKDLNDSARYAHLIKYAEQNQNLKETLINLGWNIE